MKHGHRTKGSQAGSSNLGRESSHRNVGPDGYRKTSPSCGRNSTKAGKSKSAKSKSY